MSGADAQSSIGKAKAASQAPTSLSVSADPSGSIVASYNFALP
jgi:hypothetical protein